MRICCLATSLLSCLLSTSLLAQNDIGAGTLQLQDQSGTQQQALLLGTDVSMDITGMTARVRLRQSFTNDTTQWQEGRYLLPLPDDSAVNKLKLQIADRTFVGTIHERGAAREIYQLARNEGRKAALTEQQRPNVFTQKVANIAPGETVSVELQYIQAIHYDNGRFSLRLPLTLTPRYSPATVADAGQITAPYSTAASLYPLALTLHLQAGLPLTMLDSPSHKIRVTALTGGNHDYQVQLLDNTDAMNRDFELEWQPQADHAPQAAMFYDNVGDETFTQLMLLPPPSTAVATTLPREFVIVLDTSGSMAGTSIDAAKQSVELALGRLQPDDYFNVIQFNSIYSMVFPQPVPATVGNLQTAVDFVHKLRADGGTDILPALDQALRQTQTGYGASQQVRQVVFVTDGSVGNEDAIFAMIHQQLGEARLFTVGIGSAPNTHFMRKAAEAGRGTFTQIATVGEVGTRMDALLQKLEHAVVTDVRISWPSGIDAEIYPQRVPDLYLGEPLFVTARLHGSLPATSVFTVDGRRGNQPWERQVRISGTGGGINTTMADSALATYWARQKIAGLLEGRQRGDNSDEVRAAVLAVALPFQLLSPYTSFVATESMLSRPANASLQTTAVPNAPPQGQLLAAELAQQFPQQFPQQLPYPATAAGISLHFLKSLLWGLLALLLLYRQLQQREWHD